MNDPLQAFDHGLAWLDASGSDSDIVLSTRVRLARNLQGYAFGLRSRVNDRRAVLGRVTRIMTRTDLLGDAALHPLSVLEPETRRILLERRLISRELLGDRSEKGRPQQGTAVVLSAREPVSVMVNEEDHLRLQVLVSGLALEGAWAMIDRLDEELGQELPYAYDHRLGFLTSCPTNVGTGLRASVLIHLPALVLTEEIRGVLRGLGEMGLTFRGLYGEGSEVVGNFFQVSNQTTLGKTEEDLIDHLDRMVRQVISHERRARSVLLRHAFDETEDKIWRAYGLLRYARSLSLEDMMNLLSGVRLGAALKLLPGLRVYSLNKIMIYTQPAHLEDAAGRKLSPGECDVHRAAYVRRILATEGVVAPDREPPEGGSRPRRDP